MTVPPSGRPGEPGGGSVGSALLRCVDCTAAEFGEHHWGRAPRLTRGADPQAFADLLDAAAVDELVSRRGLRTPFLRMAKRGDVLPARRFTRGGGAGAGIADQAADDRVLAVMADGATLVLQALHRTWPPLVDFGTRLAAELGHPVQINAYITPPQSQGFAAHYDVHDVFVLQVAGHKAWTIHEPVVPAPLDAQPWEKHRDAVQARVEQPPLIAATLAPGDALYLPRGTIHSAQALGETSIHLTVGVHPVTRYHLVRHLLDLLQDDPELRASLPAGVDLADPAVLAPHLAATLARLATQAGDVAAARGAEVADRLGADLMQRTRPEPVGPLAQLTAADQLAPGTPVRARAGQRLRIEQDADRIRLILLDRHIDLPGAAVDAVKVLLSGTATAPDQLPGLEPEEQLVLARRLLREGLIVPA